MVTHVELTLERLRRYAARKGGKAALSKRSGVPYATVHDLLRRGLSNRSLAAFAALEGALAPPSDAGTTDKSTRLSENPQKVNEMVNRALDAGAES